MSSQIHIVIAGLFPPQGMAAEMFANLHLPALEKLLARAQTEPLQPDTLEACLCLEFGIPQMAIAPITLRADGLDPGEFYWLRADPVSLHLQRNQMILQSGIALEMDEAEAFCASLNRHFAGLGLHFTAPHPQHWYLQLDGIPEISTHALSLVDGRDAHRYLPEGKDSVHWHGVLNEVQMLLYEHPVNQLREAAGKLPVNSIWLWGGGQPIDRLPEKYNRIIGDNDLAAAFALASHIPFEPLRDAAMLEVGKAEENLIVIDSLYRALQNGDRAEWRNALSSLEHNIVAPSLLALQSGKTGRITLDILQDEAGRRFVLHRKDLWKLWRFTTGLAKYALV